MYCSVGLQQMNTVCEGEPHGIAAAGINFSQPALLAVGRVVVLKASRDF